MSDGGSCGLYLLKEQVGDSLKINLKNWLQKYKKKENSRN